MANAPKMPPKILPVLGLLLDVGEAAFAVEPDGIEPEAPLDVDVYTIVIVVLRLITRVPSVSPAEPLVEKVEVESTTAV